MNKIIDYANGLFLNTFACEGSDYDDFCVVSNWIKFSKTNFKKLTKYKYQNECDFYHTEYDCNGSEKVTITIQRRGKYLRLKIRTQKDY